MVQRTEMFIRYWKGFLWSKTRGMFSVSGWSFPWTCSCGYEKSSPGENVNSRGPPQCGQSFTLRLRAQGKAEFPILWQRPAPHSLAICGFYLWTQWLMDTALHNLLESWLALAKYYDFSFHLCFWQCKNLMPRWKKELLVLPIAGAAKHQPRGQVQPTACLCK